jgi:hypothetical protein
MVVCPECQGSGIVSCCDTAGASEPIFSPLINDLPDFQEAAKRFAALLEDTPFFKALREEQKIHGNS